MRCLTGVALIACIISKEVATVIGQPANDACGDAQDITVSLPFSVSASNVDAVPQDFFDLPCNVAANTQRVWYEFTLTANFIASLTVSNQDFNVVLSVFSGTCGTLNCIAGTSGSRFSDQRIVLPAEASTTYYIMVSGEDDASDVGNFQLDILTNSSPNDQCSEAKEISLPFSSAATNIGAYPSFSDLACNVETGTGGIWYTFTPSTNTVVSMVVSDQDFVAVLSVFSGDSCGSLTCLFGTSGSRFSDQNIRLAATAGTAYYLVVSGKNNIYDAGAFQLSVETISSPNDQCFEAKEISLPFSGAANNIGAYPSFSDLACNVETGTGGIWYTFTPSTTNIVVSMVVSDQDFVAVLSVFSGDSCGSLTCLSSTSGSRFSDQNIVLEATAGTAYYLVVSGKNSIYDAGTFQLSVETNGPPQDPPAPDPDPPPVFCFPGNAVAEVRDRGLVPMRSLQIGDQVLVAPPNSFEQVYGFGHLDSGLSGPTKYDYLRLQMTNGVSLEISQEHMVFLQDGSAIPASTVQIGDIMHDASQVVKSVTWVTRRGAYAPFTPSGVIVVNGVKASSFIAFQESATLVVFGLDTGISFQWLARTFELPHRMWCTYSSRKCDEETYVNGISTWVYYPHKIFRSLLDATDGDSSYAITMILLVSFPVLILFGGLGLLQMLLEGGGCSGIIFLLILTLAGAQRAYPHSKAV